MLEQMWASKRQNGKREKERSQTEIIIEGEFVD